MSVPRTFSASGSAALVRSVSLGAGVGLPSQAYFLAVRESGHNHRNGKNQENGKDGVAHPLGTAFVRVDIDVRHVSAGYLGVREGRGSGGRGA